MLLMLDVGVFYEFIPLEQIDSPNREACILSDIEIGKQYAIIITTNAGLWRYIIGDTVVFTSKNPYKIKITGRIKHFINAFGEELMVDNADHALAEVCKRTGAKIREYTAAPIYMNKHAQGGHEWLIEFEQKPQNIQQFAELLDNQLKALNSDYEAKRYKDMTLQFPKVHIAPDGTFYNWLKQKGKLGGQHKIPRLANNREYIEDILQLMVND